MRSVPVLIKLLGALDEVALNPTVEIKSALVRYAVLSLKPRTLLESKPIRENEALKEKIGVLEPKYEKERIENAINKQYIINLEKVLETNNIEKPSKPSSIEDITDNTIKDSISDSIGGDKPGSPDAPNNTYPIPQP